MSKVWHIQFIFSFLSHLSFEHLILFSRFFWGMNCFVFYFTHDLKFFTSLIYFYVLFLHVFSPHGFIYHILFMSRVYMSSGAISYHLIICWNALLHIFHTQSHITQIIPCELHGGCITCEAYQDVCLKLFNIQ